MDTIKLIKEKIDSKFLTQSGTLEIISAENYMDVLKENQAKIIEVDRDYVQKFVKIGSYLKSTQKNIFKIFERILRDDFTSDLFDLSMFFTSQGASKLGIVKYIKESTGLDLKESKEFVDNNWEIILEQKGIDLDSPSKKNTTYETIIIDLNEHIISYQSLVISSLRMIKSLNEDDMITFYEMYEVFDKLGIFDTQWQKSMLEKLGDLTSSIDEVSKSLNNVNSTIKDGLDNLSQEIFDMSTDITFGLDMVSLDIQSLD